jgi:hypothetical protein
MRFILPPMRRPRHPLARALSLLLGLAVVGVLLIFGLMVAGVLLVGGGLLLVWRQWKLGHSGARPAANSSRSHPTDVLEGEFTVIRQERPVTH